MAVAGVPAFVEDSQPGTQHDSRLLTLDRSHLLSNCFTGVLQDKSIQEPTAYAADSELKIILQGLSPKFRACGTCTWHFTTADGQIKSIHCSPTVDYLYHLQYIYSS